MQKLRQWHLRGLITLSLILIIGGVIIAAVTTIPNSALISSTGYYTDQIGGGIGSAALMTGGGNGVTIGAAPNDDGFDGPLNLGFTLNFFGTNYTQYWANNNGNISFGNGISSFTPTGPQGAPQPIISPFFGDVDTRGAGSGLMYVRTDIANEIIVTWDSVGYFSENTDKLNSFQLVLRGPGFTVPSGEGQIGFWYKGMSWEAGDASGGTDGLCPTGTVGTSCFPAAVGFGDGNSNGSILQASLQSGVAGVVANHHIWFSLVNGAPVLTGPTPTPTPAPSATPAPSSIILLTLGLIALGLYQWAKVRSARS